MNFNVLDGYASPKDIDKYYKAKHLMELLGIPMSYFDDSVDMHTLYDIFMDEEKLNKIVSIMKNKAFW